MSADDLRTRVAADMPQTIADLERLVRIPSKGLVTPGVEARPKPPHDDSMPPWQSTGGVPPYILGG